MDVARIRKRDQPIVESQDESREGAPSRSSLFVYLSIALVYQEEAPVPTGHPVGYSAIGSGLAHANPIYAGTLIREVPVVATILTYPTTKKRLGIWNGDDTHARTRHARLLARHTEKSAESAALPALRGTYYTAHRTACTVSPCLPLCSRVHFLTCPYVYLNETNRTLA